MPLWSVLVVTPEDSRRQIRQTVSGLRHDGTMSTFVTTVVTSAVVSGSVTVAVDWIVRPRMDARKERILDNYRNRRDFEDNLLKLRVMSGMWARFEQPPDAAADQKERLNDEMDRAFGQIDAMSKDMLDNLGSFALTFHGIKLPGLNATIPELIARYVYLVRGICLSDRPFPAKARILEEATVPTHTWLFGGKRHYLLRFKALMELPGILDKYTSADSRNSNRLLPNANPDQP